jgi:hypothetical protein
MMNRSYEPSWSRKLMLLSALAAGGVATQFVPPYQELAFIPREEAMSAPTLSAAKSRDTKDADANTHHLHVVRTSG